MKARAGREIVVIMRNSIGLLQEVTRTIAEHGVDIVAVHGSVQGENGVIRLVTDDNLRAGDALRAKNFRPTEAEVVLVDVPHRPGALRAVTERLAQETIDLHHLYATAVPGEEISLVVFACACNDRAIVLLNTEQGPPAER